MKIMKYYGPQWQRMPNIVFTQQELRWTTVTEHIKLIKSKINK